MPKKILLKFNIVILFCVMLFASVSYASVSSERDRKILEEIWQSAQWNIKDNSSNVGGNDVNIPYAEFSNDKLDEIAENNGLSKGSIKINDGKITIDGTVYHPTLGVSGNQAYVADEKSALTPDSGKSIVTFQGMSALESKPDATSYLNGKKFGEPRSIV